MWSLPLGVWGGDVINRSADCTHYLLMERKALTGRKRVSRWSKEKIYRPETEEGGVALQRGRDTISGRGNRTHQGWEGLSSPENGKRQGLQPA